MEEVILVDENDREIGLMEKMEAHEKGLLHRAFSVFIFNNNNELLLQKRALTKYHSGGLWTNTCCSHPRQNESIEDAAKRRLMEEMGMKCELKTIFSFIYKAKLDKGLTEHELDHVLIGYTNNLPLINKDEVEEYKFIDLKTLEIDIKLNENDYTIWFKTIFAKVSNHIFSLNN